MPNRIIQDRVQAFVFDVDGTLVNAFGDISDAANAMLRELNLPVQTEEEIIRKVGYGLHYLVLHILGPAQSGLIEEGKRLFTDYYISHCGERASLYPGTREMLDLLARERKPAGVLTNKPQDLTVKTLNILGIADCFSQILGDGPDFPPKPDPTGFLHLCNRLGSRPANVIMVGDGDTDMQTAVNAGAHGWAVAMGRFTETELAEHGAERTFPDMEALAREYKLQSRA